MSKYRREQLRAKAMRSVEADFNKDSRAEMVLMMLSIATGLSVSECRRKIMELSL